MAANSEIGSGIQPKFILVEALMIVLITCKNKKDAIKNEDKIFPITQYRFTVPHKISERYCTSERNHFGRKLLEGGKFI